MVSTRSAKMPSAVHAANVEQQIPAGEHIIIEHLSDTTPHKDDGNMPPVLP